MGLMVSKINTYQATYFSKQEIRSKHKSVISSHGISSSDKDNDIPLLYWTPKFTKLLIILYSGSHSGLTKTKPLSQIKDMLTSYARNGVNRMWILINSKELLKSYIQCDIQGFFH